MKLYIAEKKEVADAIHKALGNGGSLKDGYIQGDQFQITWCSGHLYALLDPEDFDEKYSKWDLNDLPMDWPIKLKPIPRTAKQLKKVHSLLAKAKEVINCADPDAAGQKIFDDVYNEAKTKPAIVHRALFNDNNESAIIKALNNLQPNSNFKGLYLEEYARSACDQRLGYNFSRLLTTQTLKQGIKQKFTVGRVQSVILGLVVNRENGRKSHRTCYYHTISGNFETNNGQLHAKLEPTEDLGLELDHEGRFTNQTETNNLAQQLNQGSANLSEVNTKLTKESPTLPHDLLSLQVEASRLFKLSPDETLDITQKLRDKGAITYNRCDTRYLTDENHTQSPGILESLSRLSQFNWINDSEIVPSRKSRAFNTSKTTAHHAMMPTGNISKCDTFTQDENRIFALICRNFIIQFLPKREKEVTDFTINCKTLVGNVYILKGKNTRVLKDGWAKMYQRDTESDEMKNDDEDMGAIDMTGLSPGIELNRYNVSSRNQKTKPAPSYTMESLLKDLQSTAKYLTDETYKAYLLEKDRDNDDLGGIGTAATRSTLLKKLFTNSFLTESNDKKPKIYPTTEGEVLYSLIPKRVTSPEMTAIWAHNFELIKKNEKDVNDFIDEQNVWIQAEVQRVKANGLDIPTSLATKDQSGYKAKCPKCSAVLFELDGKFGKYYPCKSCKVNFSSYRHKLMHKECSSCGSDMKMKKSKSGRFYGCANYPECKNTEDI
ncbi:DNA topoisomerase [Vibrio barjaei]|uniref:DNA topoisomerase n=1 Tax=Vibrio barjaei TaxID=1676683 RepID=UPI002284DF54|nr:DNA topoisomerase [Vibrio barjaei]MCY9872286.1 DNA topoisomerase [Vibrio barjaei]